MDRQLGELSRALQQRLTRLESEVRVLRQRTAWNGAVRSTPITPVTILTNTAVTLATVDVTAGAWLLMGWLTAQIDDAGAGADYTGADVVSGTLYRRLAEEPSTTPVTMIDTAAMGVNATARNATGAAFFTVSLMVPFSSENGASIFFDGSTGDFSGNSHNFLFRNGWLIALPL